MVAKGEMMETKGRRKGADAQICAAKKFGHYKDEPELGTRTPKVRPDEKTRELIKAWTGMELKVSDIIAATIGGECDRGYEQASTMVKTLKYSSGDVERFAVALGMLQGERLFGIKSGLFISALINLGPDREYSITTAHLGTPPTLLGYHNVKDVRIKGNAGPYACSHMEGGNFVLDGNASHYAGFCMEGGNLMISGNAGNGLGGGSAYQGHRLVDRTILIGERIRNMPELRPITYYTGMTGGMITLRGDAGDLVGLFMRGGEIHVDGELGGIGKTFGGARIFHKGILVRG